MLLLEEIIAKARTLKKKIVLPETHDERIISATRKIVDQDIATVVLVGDRMKLTAAFSSEQLKKIIIYDPQQDKELAEQMIQLYLEKRGKKGVTPELARETVLTKPHFFGALLVEKNLADGMVCGADCTTAETLRALIHCVGVKQGSTLISSFFIIITEHKEMGKDGVLFFADCAVNPQPDSAQLACIATDTADSYKKIMHSEPQVGLLSFSTYGSAEHPLVDKVKEAVRMAKANRPDIKLDGEFQFDAAVIPKIGEKKAPGSLIAGKVNCLVFPDLQAGNIGYKIAERIGNAMAVGPIIQGAKKPVNDLSRGCSVDDIFYVTAITSLQVG